MEDNLKPNTTFSHYRILQQIGAGGMGEVYLAEDTRLRRKVALKVLPENLASDKERLRRFEQEAFAASALNHPNILTIYEFGVENDVHFLATEYVEGETLKEKLKDGLNLNEVLDIVQQTAFALAAAHAAGIVHRDIKPENIMIRRDGFVKVLDFGLAKLTERKTEDTNAEAETRALVRTNPGVVMGTVAFMSPEQARGKETDERTDIWSLGVVLYEMVTGRLAFAGETMNDAIAAILTKEPLPLTQYISDVPAELQRIVGKTLRKDPEERYQHVKDLRIDLKDLKQELEFAAKLERSAAPNTSGAQSTEKEAPTQTTTKDQLTEAMPNAVSTADITASDTHQTSSAEYVVSEVKKHKRGFALALIVLLFAAIGSGYWFFSNRATSAKQIESIAVLPFVNESGNAENEYLSDGMTESLIGSLSQLPKLAVKARSSVFRYKGKDVSPQTIGQELKVQAILMGRVAQRGEQLILNLELVDAETENVIWSDQYNRKQTDLVALQNEIARDVSNKLRARLSGADEQKVTKNYTTDPEAYQLYLKGRFYWNKRTAENLKRAIEQFRAAAEKDPNYALAYVGLADSYALLEEYAGTPASETLPQARSYAMRALAIDDSLAEAHASLGKINEDSWKWAEAEREYKRAIELNPNYPTAHHWYSLFLKTMGRMDESEAVIKRAQELDPLSNVINANISLTYLVKNDLNSAVEHSRKMIDLDPTYANTHEYLGLAYLKQGRNSEAITALEKAAELSNRASVNLGALGFAYAVTGKRDEAYVIIKEMEEKYAKQEALGIDIAAVYAGLGEKDQAFAWLEKDFQSRSGELSYIRWGPPYEPLHGDPRYTDLLRRMNLPQ
jgi:eukaryotic-like serine/threonine-protein kinase